MHLPAVFVRKEIFMIKVKTVLQQLIDERKKNALLSAKLERLTSDLDYVAMMCDVELEEEENE